MILCLRSLSERTPQSIGRAGSEAASFVVRISGWPQGKRLEKINTILKSVIKSCKIGLRVTIDKAAQSKNVVLPSFSQRPGAQTAFGVSGACTVRMRCIGQIINQQGGHCRGNQKSQPQTLRPPSSISTVKRDYALRSPKWRIGCRITIRKK